MKETIMILLFGMITAVFDMVGSASAVEVDIKTNPAGITIERQIEKRIAEMQKEIIRRNFTARLLKNRMRADMMATRVPQKFFQGSMQPVIAEKARTMILPVMAEKVRTMQMKALMIR
jgi:hypothetical protein